MKNCEIDVSLDVILNNATPALRRKIVRSVEILRKSEKLALQYRDFGFWLAFSGGKDSQCLYHIAKLAGVRFGAHYSRTGIDPPELVHFIMREYPDVVWDRPDMTFWELIVKKRMLPTRQNRYCCEVLKESRGGGGCDFDGCAQGGKHQKGEKECV